MCVYIYTYIKIYMCVYKYMCIYIMGYYSALKEKEILTCDTT